MMGRMIDGLSFSDFIDRCAEDCNCNGGLFSDSDGKTLVKKLAQKLDASLVIWYDDIAKIPDTDVSGATFYRVIDGVITNETITLAEFLKETNWGARSYMIVGLGGDNEHYWAIFTCGSITWYKTKQSYAFESTAGFVEMLAEEFPIPITDGRS